VPAALRAASDDPVTIDVLVVYTPAAENWAATYMGVTDIHDVIAQGIEIANIVMENSNTGVTFNVVYEYKTDYVETNSELDLQRITYNTDDYLKDVHLLRDIFYADLVLFVPDINYVAGQAQQLLKVNGDPNRAFALSGVR
jgi:hypothetical protein